MSLTIIVTENVAPRLRGYLAIWMTEVRAGVYVANLSARRRDLLWTTAKESISDGNAVLISSTRTESGFDMAFAGENRRIPIDFDGMRLVQIVDSRS